MRRLLSIAAVLALATARPGTYKETEDFNYQRSSTDEGSKSGFYNAQRGNMGGNYERAHNMDGLAQHQMSTAVKQVEGELGEASKLKSGQVFTSAQSGGMFGSGHYDLSNLQGRNFHENHQGAESQSHSSLSSHQSAFDDHLSSSMRNSAHNSYGRNSGYGVYQGTKTGQLADSSNLQAVDDVGVVYGSGLHREALGSRVSLQSGYHSQNAYESANTNHQSAHAAYGAVPQNRLIYTAPVRVYGRPGSRVAIPVGVQTYDATHSASTLGHRGSASALDHSASAFDHSASAFDHSASTYDHSASSHGASNFDQSASTIDHNAINTEAELLNTGDQHVAGYRPSSNAKHYSSSYNYRKQWEKHEAQPEAVILAIPNTESPFPKNSELYDDAQLSNSQYHASGVNSHSGYSSSMHNAHNSNVKSSLSASQLHQSAIDAQRAASLSSLNAQTHGAYNSANSADTANVLEGVDTKPKSYQSSYSYHKAWERQGDPYVIKPVSGAYTNLDSQSLTDASSHLAYNHNSGSNYQKTQQGYTHGNGLEDCDTNGYRRVARSVRANDDFTQQSQTNWNVDDLGQHTQTSWDLADSLREAHNYRNREIQQQQQNQFENLEDLGQQTQTIWDQSEALRQAHYHQHAQQEVQQHQWGKSEDLGQQTQNSWDQSDALRLAHNHQHAQTQQNEFGKLEDLGQVQQNSWNLEDLTQQTQQLHKWDGQRHPDQAIANAWKGYVSEPNKPESQHLYQNHDQESREMTQSGTVDFNQVQQSPSNSWDFLDQHQIQQEQTLFKYPGEKEVENQQANIIWAASEDSDKHKHSNHHQQEEEEITQIGSSNVNQEQQVQSIPWDSLDQQQTQQEKTYSKEIEQQQANLYWAPSKDSEKHKYNNLHQQEEEKITETGSPEDNQGQQIQSNSWDSLGQQIQQEQTYIKGTEQQQANINWAGPKHSEHKYNNQHQQEVVKITQIGSLDFNQEKQSQSNSWDSLNRQQIQQTNNHHQLPSNGYGENSYHSYGENYSSKYHHNQKDQHKFDTGSFALYDWTQASADKTDNDFSQLGSLWDKISEVDGQFSASNSQMGREYQNNFNLNQGNYNSNQHTMILTSSAKPIITTQTAKQILSTTEIPKNTQISRQDIGRGDIGPEEEIIEPYPPTTFQESKPKSLTKEMKNNLTIELIKEVNNNEKVDEEIRNHQSYNFNFTQNNSWKQENHNSEHSSNQTTLHSSHHGVYKYNKGESHESKNYTSIVEQKPKFSAEKELKPLNQWATSLNNDASQKSSEKIMPQNSVQLTEIEPVDIQQQQQNLFKFDTAEFGHVSQSLDQQWQQTQQLKEKETFWGQSEDYPEQSQMQQPAETFGVRMKDEQLQVPQEKVLAESFKRESEPLDAIYRSNHSILHYTQANQMEAHLQTREGVVDEQKTHNAPIEPTTVKPGFFKRIKNKVWSLFSSDKDTTENPKTKMLE